MFQAKDYHKTNLNGVRALRYYSYDFSSFSVPITEMKKDACNQAAEANNCDQKDLIYIMLYFCQNIFLTHKPARICLAIFITCDFSKE